MKFQVNIDTEQVVVHETISGENEEAIWKQARKEIEHRAPFLARTVIRMMSDQALWSRVTHHINEGAAEPEPVPTNAKQFIELGIRKGFVTRLD